MQRTERSRTFTWESPSVYREAGRRLGGLEFLNAIGEGELPVPPMLRALGIEAVHVEEGRAIFAAEPREYHMNPLGVAHAGLAMTLLDTAMGCAVHSRLPPGIGYLTLELKVNFVRALVPGMGRVTCEGRTIHMGSRVATAEARLVEAEGRLCAHATSTCLILGEGSQTAAAVSAEGR